MAKRYTHLITIPVELAGGCLGRGVTHTLLCAIEPNERVESLDQHGFVPAVPRGDIAEDFNNNRAQQIENRRGANEIVKALCLPASLLLGSVAVRTARVVAAKRRIRIYTTQQVGDRKRRRPRVDGRWSQRPVGWNAIVTENRGCLVRPLAAALSSGERGQLMAACL